MTTRSCPTTSVGPPEANCPCGPDASSASTANFSPPWPARRARCCASRGATCAATWSGSRPAGSSRSPVLWPASGGGRATCSAPTSWIAHVASFDAGIRRMAFPATEQEHRLRSLMAHGSTRLSVRGLAAAGDAALGAGAEVVGRPAQRSVHPLRRQPRRAGGALPADTRHLGHPAGGLGRRARSPTSCSDVLGVEEVENPEDELQITPLVGAHWSTGAGGVHHRSPARVRPTGPAPTRPWSEATGPSWSAIGERRLRRLRATRPDRPPDLLAAGQATASSRISGGSSMQDDAHRAEPRRRGRWPPSWPSGSRGRRSARSPCTCPTVGRVGSGARPTGSTWRATAVCRSSTTRRASADRYRDLSEDNPDARGRMLQLAVYGARRPALSRDGPTPPCGPSTGSSRPAGASAHRLPGDPRGPGPGRRDGAGDRSPASRPESSPITRRQQHEPSGGVPVLRSRRTWA